MESKTFGLIFAAQPAALTMAVKRYGSAMGALYPIRGYSQISKSLLSETLSLWDSKRNGKVAGKEGAGRKTVSQPCTPREFRWVRDYSLELTGTGSRTSSGTCKPSVPDPLSWSGIWQVPSKVAPASITKQLV